MAIGMRPDILTVSGNYFSFVDPERSEFGIEDIAHALSNICRFAGHSCAFYSVAQHSVQVSMAVPRKFAFAGLLHDAAEAFLGDVARPLKQLLPDYRRLEAQITPIVLQRFGLPRDLPPAVKEADLLLLATEQRDLMPAHDDEWALLRNVTPLEHRIRPLPPQWAKQAFLARFRDLAADE